MVDLYITGALENQVFEFIVENEAKKLDQFTKTIHFQLENTGFHRIYFVQKESEYIPRRIEKILNLLFLPLYGLFNILTFNVEHTWEKSVVGFKVSGYIDININKNTKIEFEYTPAFFELSQERFRKPYVSFSSECHVVQEVETDKYDIQQKSHAFARKTISVSLWFYALFVFLLVKSVEVSNYTFAFLLFAVILFSGFIALILIKNYNKKKHLICILTKQKTYDDKSVNNNS